jgi:N-acetylglucosamine kinase-like BadF-type ATPase
VTSPVASVPPGRLLGIDAGGSGTRVVVLEGGQVTPQPDGPPMNALLTVGFAVVPIASRSAYWIGREAIRSALRFQEHAGGSELIHRAVTRGSGLDILISQVNANPADRGRLTVLAPAVTAIAEYDPEAQRIIRCAAEHLAALAVSVRRRLGPLPVAGAGGVFRSPAIWSRFAEVTGAARPLAPAAVGAALLAATCTGRSPSASCSFHGVQASLGG